MKFKLNLSTLLVALIGFFLLACTLLSIGIQSSIRTSITAEALWSKAQKDATQELILYTATPKSNHFDRFIQFTQTPRNYRMVRVELEREWPDFEKTDRLLVETGLDAREVRAMGYLFRFGKTFKPITDSLAIWSEGDLIFDQIIELSKIIKTAGLTTTDRTQAAAYWTTIEELNQQLTRLEVRFTQSLSNGAILFTKLTFWLSILVFSLTFSIILAVFAHMTRSRRKLEAKTSQFNTLVEGLNRSVIVATTDVKGNILYCNDKCLEITGYSSEELVGQNHRILNSGFHPRSFFEDLWKTISSGEVWRAEICNRSKRDEIYWVDSMIMPVSGAKGERQYMSVRIDITKTKLAAQALIQSSRMATLGEMSAGIAHEINNPLAIIAGSASLITKFLNDPQKLSAKLDSIQKSVSRIQKIVLGLKKFSRTSEPGVYSPRPLSLITKEALTLSEPKANQHVTQVIFESKTNTAVNCNEVEIEQVLINLVNNAVDAVKDLTDRWIKIELYDDLSEVVLKVTDSGGGISDTVKDKIFEPFFTTKKVGEGTGLGLSITKGILDQHGAKITVVENSPNTCFELRFQKAEDPETA